MGAGSSRPEAEQPAAAAAPAAPTKSAPTDFETVFREELALQAAAMPLDDVPSCLTLFDRWLTCYSLVPQFRHLYRYGAFTDCGVRKEDFKACLTLRSLEPDERRDGWLRRRAERATYNRMSSRSSEAVWTMRRDPIIPECYVDGDYKPPA